MKKLLYLFLALVLIPVHAEASSRKHKHNNIKPSHLFAGVAGLIGISILADSIANSNYHKPYYSTSNNRDYYNKDGMVWMPGHYEIVQEKVWIPARKERVWVEPVYERRRHHRVLIREGYYKKVIIPGYYDIQERKVWVEGRYEVVNGYYNDSHERCVY